MSYPSGALPAGCARPGRVAPVHQRPPRMLLPPTCRRQARLGATRAATSQRLDDASTSTLSPLPAHPAVSEPPVVRAAWLLGQRVPATQREPSQSLINDRPRLPVGNRLPRAVRIGIGEVACGTGTLAGKAHARH